MPYLFPDEFCPYICSLRNYFIQSNLITGILMLLLTYQMLFSNRDSDKLNTIDKFQISQIKLLSIWIIPFLSFAPLLFDNPKVDEKYGWCQTNLTKVIIFN